jgi:hypothetical protein
LLPALSSAWSPPVVLSSARVDAGFPSITRDADNRLHALWTEVLPVGLSEPALFYARNDGLQWNQGGSVLRAPEPGPANTPLLVAGPGDRVHAVWSGGLAGQVYYSQAFARDAGQNSGWHPAVPLPAPRPVGGWPVLHADATGRLRVLFTIPVNEDRGLYLTESTDQGVSWSPPVTVFNAAAAGWLVVQDTQFVIDEAGGLHVLMVRGALPPAAATLGAYYTRSTDGGQTWTEPAPVGSENSNWPRLIVTQPGELHRVWVEQGELHRLVQHQWSLDGGTTWSTPAIITGLTDPAPNLGLAADGSGALYLTGIETTSQASAALFFLRWDGISWTNYESVPLGYAADDDSGTTAILLPSGRLGVLFHVVAAAGPQAGLHLVGYLDRPLESVTITPLATLTPAPLASQPPTEVVPPTLTPAPTLDLNTDPQMPISEAGSGLRIAGVLAAMGLVIILAFWGLRVHRR